MEAFYAWTKNFHLIITSVAGIVTIISGSIVISNHFRLKKKKRDFLPDSPDIDSSGLNWLTRVALVVFIPSVALLTYLVFFFNPSPEPDQITIDPRPNLYLPRTAYSIVPEYHQRYVEKIREVLSAGPKERTAVVVLTGQPGLGQDLVALEYAYSSYTSNKYPGGVYWLSVDLGLAEAIRRMADLKKAGDGAFGKLPKEEKYVIQKFIAHLTNHPGALVVLDSPLLPDLLDQLQCHGVHFLIVSPLRDFPHPQVAMALPDDQEAGEIFLAYLGRKKETLSLKEAEALGNILRRVSNLPLALELLSGKGRISLVELTRELEQLSQAQGRLQVQGGQVRVGQAIDLAVETALKGLDQNNIQPILKALGYLHPTEGLNGELLVQLAVLPEKETRGIVEELTRRSLLKVRPDGGLSLHPLLQEVFRENDQDHTVGLRVAAYLDERVKEAANLGQYLQAYPLLPHLVYLTGLAGDKTPEEAFPPESLISQWASFFWAAGLNQAAEKGNRTCLARVRAANGEGHHYATSLNNLAAVLQAGGKYVEAEQLFRQALEIDERTIGPEHPGHATHLSNLAGVLAVQGKTTEAEKLFRQALEIDAKTIGAEHPEYANCLNGLAGVLGAQGKYAEAEDLYRQALDVDARSIGPEHPSYAVDLNNLAGALQAQGKYSEAEKLYRQALEIEAKTIGQAHPQYTRHLSNLAGALREEGSYPEAEKLYRQALEIEAKTIGQEHPDYTTHLNNLAGVLGYQGKVGEAETFYRQVLEIDERTTGKEHPNYAEHLNDLARVLDDQGRHAEAEKLYRQALEIAEKIFGREHPNYATGLNNLAAALSAQGKYSEAEKLYRQALEIGKKTIGEEHPSYAISLNNLAEALRSQGKYVEAVRLSFRALEIGKKTFGENHPHYAMLLNNIARFVWDAGLLAEAEALLAQAVDILLARLGPDHLHTVNSQAALANLRAALTRRLPPLTAR